jgi:23S rRNA (adenine2030-N6)-methyltransferase
VTYDHRYHVGNRADVWKHVALLAVLASLKQVAVAYTETHAGRGRYLPHPNGEWTVGVGALLGGDTGNGAVDRYLARVRRTVPTLPGSPALAAGSLGRRDTLLLHEASPESAADLAATFAQDGRARVIAGDGWSMAVRRPGAAGPRNVILIDPPYVGPDDWRDAGDALCRWHGSDPEAVIALWLPIKRWTRPNALRARLRAEGVAATHLDLCWARPEGREDLAGSGLTLLNPPSAAVAEILAAGSVLGPRLAIDGHWSVGAST